MNNKANVTQNAAARQITVSKNFDAPIDTIWQAFTSSNELDKWWAPKPWKAETKDMNFAVGGRWLYAMVSPEGQKHWSTINYTAIQKPHYFEARDAFTDEAGNENTGMPSADWRIDFNENNGNTKVEMTLTFATEEDMNKLVEMGFNDGIQMTLENLAQQLEQ